MIVVFSRTYMKELECSGKTDNLSGPKFAFMNCQGGPLVNCFQICFMKNNSRRQLFSSARIFGSSLPVQIKDTRMCPKNWNFCHQYVHVMGPDEAWRRFDSDSGFLTRRMLSLTMNSRERGLKQNAQARGICPLQKQNDFWNCLAFRNKTVIKYSQKVWIRLNNPKSVSNFRQLVMSIFTLKGDRRSRHGWWTSTPSTTDKPAVHEP